MLIRRERLALDGSVLIAETSGCCRLPTPATIAVLTDLFDDTQAGRTYWILAQHEGNWKALHTLGLTDGVTGDLARPSGALREPARFVGINLFRRLSATHSPEGRLSAQQVIWKFLEDHKHEPASGSASPGLGCILINLSLLRVRNAWYDALLLLPWEALTEPDHPAPLHIERPIVIVRTIAADPYQPPQNVTLDQPIPMLPLLPSRAMTPSLREAERRARPYHLRLHRSELVWCDCPKPRIGCKRSHVRKALQQHAPVALHYFGHGAFQPRAPGQPLSALQIDDALLGALELATLTQDSPIWLFSCFACHSGTPGDQSQQPLSSDRWSMINAFSSSVPAMLMMTVSISATAAGVAGEAWYAALARGETLLHAAYSMRRALWRHSLGQQSRWVGDLHAWWIPALYLRHPRWNRALVDHSARRQNLQPRGQYHPPNQSQSEQIEEIFERIERSRYRVVNVHGQAQQASRTTILYQIARKLHELQHDYLLLSAPGDAQQSSIERLALLKNVIATRLRQTRGLHVHWDRHALKRATSEDPISGWLNQRYLTELKAPRRKPFWVLIDDIDQLGDPQSRDSRNAFHGLSLLPLHECSQTQVRFVVTTRNPEFGRRLYIDTLKIETDETISIPRLFIPQLPHLSNGPNFTAWYVERKDRLAYRLLAVLLVADQALHVTTMQEYCAMKALGEDNDVVQALKDLEDEKLVYRDGERCRARLDAELIKHWNNDPATAGVRADTRRWFEEWYERSVQNSLRKQRGILPEDLLRLILTGTPSRGPWSETPSPYETADYNFSEGTQQDRPLYRWWLILLRSASACGLNTALASYVARLLDTEATPYTTWDREILKYIQRWLQGTEEQNAFQGLADKILIDIHDSRNAAKLDTYHRALKDLRIFFEQASQPREGRA